MHITKVPPSDSGIARHAAALDRALDAMGDRVTIGLPIDAHESQRVWITLRLCGRVVRHIGQRPIELVVVDLSGRALAEFFAVCLLAARRRRPTIWLIAHDAPELVGPPMLFSLLDRKGGRRVGKALSALIGKRLTRWLLRRSAVLLAFSELGAQCLRDCYSDDVAVWAIPLPTELLVERPKEPVVYCPAGTSVTEIQPVLDELEAGRLGPNFRVRVGRLPLAARRTIESKCEANGTAPRVEHTGELTQAGLDTSFETAAVVVRNLQRGENARNWGAASGPIVSALAAGCAVLSTDSRGSARCVAAAGVEISTEPSRLAAELHRVTHDVEYREVLQQRARAHTRDHHTPEAVAGYLASVWSATHHGPGRC